MVPSRRTATLLSPLIRSHLWHLLRRERW